MEWSPKIKKRFRLHTHVWCIPNITPVGNSSVHSYGNVLRREDGHELWREDGHELWREDGHVLRREDAHVLRSVLDLEVDGL